MGKDPGFAFEPIDIDVVPKDERNCSRINLYVFLSAPRKYILYIAIGDELSKAKINALEKHSLPILYARSLDLEALIQKIPLPETKLENIEFQVLGPTTNKVLFEIYEGLFEEKEPPAPMIEKLNNLSREIIAVIAPEVGNVKKRLLENLQYVWIMNDSTALISIATLFFLANGIDSRVTLRDLVHACLVMDLPLSKIGKEKVDQIIFDPKGAEKHDLAIYREHPKEAFNAAKKTLQHYSDAACELILTHHELHNGAGFPTGTLNAGLFLPAQVFSVAVETFERLKKKNLEPQSDHKSSQQVLIEIVRSMMENDVDAHLRRHTTEILSKIEAFLLAKA
jgi:response regulator RpfG family c-di-GMP phosphodiesterase